MGGMGEWEPPGAQFVHGLTDFVSTLLKKREMERWAGANTQYGEGLLQRSKSHKASEKEQEMLITPTDIFDEGLRSLRSSPVQNPDAQNTLAGNYNLCLRTAKTRRALYGMMLD